VSNIHHSLQMPSGYLQHAQTGYIKLTQNQTNTNPDPVDH